jgi:hypothetical protein
MIPIIIITIWLALSPFIGWLWGRFVRVGMVELRSSAKSRTLADMIDTSSIERDMVESRHYDVSRHVIQYRWDFGPYFAHNEFYCGSGSESEWAQLARKDAARVLVEMVELQNSSTNKKDENE